MRTTWNGSLSFGLVSIPVGLAPATKPAARQSDVSFRLLHRECSTPIKQKRWCPTHDREVSQDEIVRGFEVTKGQFLIVEDADLEAIERADDSRSIEITRFVPEDDVDPIFFDRTYFLVPAAGYGAAPTVRAPARGDAADRDRGARPVRPRGPREPLPRPREGRRARARDALPRRGRPLAGRDLGGGRGDEGEEVRARPRAAGDRQPRRRVRAVRSSRASTGATCARCSRRRCAARRSSRPSPSRSRP